jgi:tRNA A37 threonylcarbamoyltransferase TsaD
MKTKTERMSQTKTKIALPSARILGIESSCDETSIAVVENGRCMLSNVIASQIDLHAKYGGVFPEVASRQHIRTIYAILDQALQQAHLGLSDIDAIAVTRGPGLAGSLVVGYIRAISRNHPRSQNFPSLLCWFPVVIRN